MTCAARLSTLYASAFRTFANSIVEGVLNGRRPFVVKLRRNDGTMLGVSRIAVCDILALSRRSTTPTWVASHEEYVHRFRALLFAWNHGT